MTPDLLALCIPIVALMIPIVAILAKSDIGQAFAHYLRSKATPPDQLAGITLPQQQLLLTLEERVRSLEDDLKQVKENTAFIHKLLAEKNEPEQSIDS